MRIVFTFLCGLVFGLGLIVSGMTSPDKVLAFLDIAGNWDPSLAFVMGGAILAALPLFYIARRRDRPVAGDQYDTPGTTLVDRKLVAGAVLFGIGWGVAGICPGPALVDLAIAPVQTLPFIAAMILGIIASARLRAG